MSHLKKNYLIVFMTLTFLFSSCITKTSKMNIPFPIEKEPTGITPSFYSNHSTSPNFVVVQLRNLNSDQKKEVCLESGVLCSLISHELNRNPKQFIDSLFNSSNNPLHIETNNASFLEKAGFNKPKMKEETINEDELFKLMNALSSAKTPLPLSTFFKPDLTTIKQLFHFKIYCFRDCESGTIMARTITKKS